MGRAPPRDGVLTGITTPPRVPGRDHRGTGRTHQPEACKELAIETAIVLVTCDLRVRDNPALATASEQVDLVVPLSVVDASVMSAAPNRAHFLLDSLADLREILRSRGGDLAVRHGRPQAEVIRLAIRSGQFSGNS